MNNTASHNDEIDLKEVFRTISRYKKSIIFITFIFLIASSIFAYYKPNVYSSFSSVQVTDNSSGGGASSTDFMMQAIGGKSSSIDNEIAILESRFITQKALENLNLTTKYYSYNKLQKKLELYKNSPFIITQKTIDNSIYFKNFELIPIDDTSYRLIIEPLSPYSLKSILDKLGLKALKEEDKITYNEVHRYNEEIDAAWFSFTVNKIGKLESSKYSFQLLNKDSLYDTYSSGLSVSLDSEYGSTINLDYQDNVSLRAKEILDSITEAYLADGIKEKSKVAELTLGFIDSQLETINTQLSSSEKDVQKFKRKTKVLDISTTVALATEKVATYEAEQTKLRTEMHILENLQHFIAKNSDLSGLTLGTINFADKSLAKLVMNLQEMTDQKNLLLVDYTKIHPEVIKLARSISSTKRSINRALASSLRQLTQRDNDLTRMINKYKKSLNSLPSQEVELASLSRPLKVNEMVYEYLLQKKAETAILKSSTIADAKILDSARENSVPIKPKRKLIVIVGLILGLIVGIALAFLREFLVYTVQNVEEIEKLTSLPIYGVIPLNKDKITKNIYAEAFRNIRTNLQFLPGNDNNQIISITSSVSGEGKTTITAALSEVLARGDKKVIMLDLDMRKASLHKEFDITNNIGISNYLTMQNTLEEVTKETSIYGLSIITTGPLPPNPSELILSNMFTKLLDKLRETYDYIIIDTPPAGLVTDATIIMNYSDISFSIVRAKYTRKEFVKNIDRMAKDYSHNRMGIILNGTLIGSEYGYGYGASYAYGYGNAKYYKDRN